MRLNVALVDCGGFVAAFDHDIGGRHRARHIAAAHDDLLRDVGGLIGLRGDALGEHVGVQQRRIGRHRGFDFDDVRQHVVRHVDETHGFIGDFGRCRGDGGDGMARVERFFARHAVDRDIEERRGAFAVIDIFALPEHEVRAGDDGFDARKRGGGAGIDLHDLGVRVRAALDAAGEHAGKVEVRAELGAAGDFIGAVRAHGALADDFQRAAACCSIAHRAAPALLVSGA